MTTQKKSIIPTAALFVSAISLLVSGLTFYRSSPDNELRRRQDEKMRIIASEAIIIFDQLKTIAAVQVDTNIKIENNYLFPLYQKNIKRLENSLDEGIGLGLFDELIGDKKYAIEMNVAFRQDLAWMETLDYKDCKIEDWSRNHFTMGIIRLMDQCVNYRKDVIPLKFSEAIKSKIEPLRENAWNYLDK